ncbi:putative transcription factor AS2-LOB family [Helianthus annuus]|nr:putative transcription factor AS2-LOB family [Helianthus annuus]KAJ0842342.1 putative transcription factor AS2-LOB family [Helianthus annuus]
MSRERERFDEIGKKIKRDIDASFQLGRRHMLGLPGTLNTITPCAACKLLRRRCAQECPFSPYFSPHEPQKFASVHKVFGASNVSKLLMEVPENQRADAANSLVYEANVRLRDPVYGCMGAISALQHQVQSLQAELNAVRAEILRYKYSQETHHDHNNIIPSTHHLALFSTGTHVPVTAPPPPTPPPPATPLPTPPPPPPPPPPSSSSSSIYTPPSTTTDYNTITNDNISYFG